jgi:hypothetical protein
MSTISNDTTNYQAYQKQIADYEDETTAEQKRQKELSDARIASLEKSQAQNLRKQSDDYSRTISDVKKNDNATLTQERDYAKQEAEQTKREMYDRYGRMSDNESSAHKKQVEDLQHTGEIREKQFNEQMKLSEEHAENAAERMNRQSREASDNALGKMRETFTGDQDSLRSREAASRQALNDDHQKHLSEMSRDHGLDLQMQQRQTEKAIDTLQTDSARRVDQARVAYEKSTARQEREMQEGKNSDVMKLRDAHAQETQDLHNQIRNLVSAEGVYVKERGQGTQDAIREYDGRWNDRLQAQNSSFTAEIADMKDQAHRQEKYLDHSANEMLKDKDLFYATQMRKQNDDNHHIQKENENQFQRSLTDVTKSAKNNSEKSQAIYENQVKGLAEHNQEVMIKQAEAFQGTEAQHEAENRQQISQLQRALQEKNTTSDPTQISPAAESNLRKQVAMEYGKVQQADQNRNEKRFDKLSTEYRDRYMDLAEQAKSKETRTNRAIASERTQDRNEFVAHVTETEEGKNMALRSQEQQHDRETELMNRNYSRMLGRKSQEHDDALSVTRDDAANRIAEIRQEADFNSKMAQRSFSVRQNELIRDYEKKLADQKTDYDSRLDDAKSQGQASTRDVERKLKTELDSQSRASEQRLAQLDAQYKERERYLTNNFQDEIEKVKHSNALLVQKKS